MTRAEEAALKAYPKDRKGVLYDLARKSIIQGYEQAEKEYIELAQLWVDSGDVNVMSFERFLKCHETQGNK